MPEETSNPDQVQNLTVDDEVYPLNYIVNFNNCTFNNCTFTIKQTGKPPEPPADPPGGGDGEGGG